jgi:hypothetical protein
LNDGPVANEEIRGSDAPHIAGPVLAFGGVAFIAPDLGTDAGGVADFAFDSLGVGHGQGAGTAVSSVDAAAEDLKKAMPMSPRGGGAGKPATPPPSIKRTGQKSVVAGIPCEEWEVKQDRDRALVCMAEESASWFKLPTKALPDDLGFAAEMIDGKHFPLRVVAFKGEGQEAKIEVKAIEKKTVADTEFQVPAGYAQIDVVQMLKSFGGMGASGAPPGMMVPGAMPPGAMPPGKVPTKPKK